jgi:hypothetical protein
MNVNDPQVVLWSKWTGLTAWAGGHMQYSCFDHNGNSGGSLAPFTPRRENYLFAVRMGWITPDATDHVIYEHSTLQFAAHKTIDYAIPN